MELYSKPKKIDPNKIYGMLKSDYTTQLDNYAAELMDPRSAYNQSALQDATRASADASYNTNRINRMNMAASGMGGQSGIIQQNASDTINKNVGNVQESWLNKLKNNFTAAIGITQGNQQADIQARQGMAQAYGQNITNENNWSGAMAGNVMGAGMALLCDANMKENIKPIGRVKTKNGKQTGLYEFNYIGSTKKKRGIIAQDVRNVVPDAVFKGKNGKLYVNLEKLF